MIGASQGGLVMNRERDHPREQEIRVILDNLTAQPLWRVTEAGQERALATVAPHVLLVTSAYHMPRSVALFEPHGLRVRPGW